MTGHQISKHTQCTLKRGNVFEHAWIPSQFAVVGKYLKLDGENGWLVVNCGAQMDSEMLRTHNTGLKKAFPSLQKGKS